jgi:cephalosporin-C deacetylase
MPLTFDLPFDQLKLYQGINPRPDDFDIFWDKGLTEICITQVSAGHECMPSCYDLPRFLHLIQQS